MPPTDADRPGGDGPDGSSIKPVSSLLARFENMNKPGDAPQSQQPPSRAISPAPKPDRLRDFKPMKDATATTNPSPAPGIPPKPKDFSRATTLPTSRVQPEVAAPHPSSRPPPASRTVALVQELPAVMIEPPQSPPQKRISTLPIGDRSAFLNPDHATAPASPVGTPTQLKISSRPVTPTHAIPALPSPRLISSQPPSPPPPRRSAELRRERDARSQPTPLTPRHDKPLIPAHKPVIVPHAHQDYKLEKAEITRETSPFNSPPATPEDETPPVLPTRPRPQVESYPEEPSRPRSTLGGFGPPPVHHSVANRRMERGQGLNGSIKALVASQVADDQRQGRFARTQTAEVLHMRQSPDHLEALPQPPRPNASANSQVVESRRSMLPPKRIPSGPATQLLPPPARQHGRSKTMDAVPTLSDAHIPAVESKSAGNPRGDSGGNVPAFPDGSNANRRPPFIKKGCYEIVTKYDPRIFDVCGDYICTSGQLTRVWSLLDGEQLLSLAHTEGVKATAVAFKPAAHPKDEGARLWIGTSVGDIMEVEVATQSILCSRSVHGRHEVTRIYRHLNELWTMDEAGTLLIWSPDQDQVLNVERSPAQSYKVPRAQTFSMVIGDELWHATGREMRVFAPTLDGRNQFQVLLRPLMVEGAGDVTSGTLVKTRPGKAFFGHADGKISIWSTADYSCSAVLTLSGLKLSSLAGIGDSIWAAYNSSTSGKICVYDTRSTPWTVKKEWQAHDGPITKMLFDAASSYRQDRLQVVSLGADNKVRVWDGLLQDDWLEDDLKSKEDKYCEFEEIRALVFTWNAGASTPHGLRYSGNDANFFPDLLQSSESPDILVFSFQELVDLEDKTATAKRLLKGKKKEGPDQERMAHQYRDWRDFLIKTLDDYMPSEHLYHLLQSAPLVGLFTCIFVKASLRDRVRNLSASEVKRGMGGVYGNKGAVAIRFQIDDSSLCFVNCHLAAGQTQAAARHADVAAILDANLFPPERDLEARIDTYAGGGDGTMILDHELCILNGDLNYRIDTMSRDTVVTALKNRNLGKLLDRDQLLVARRRNAAFRLRVFEELPITFAPTYKYDVGTTTYDTSEKRRSPAWCDRVLYRGRGRIEQTDYRRHEVLVSDHRPVSGMFRLWVKQIDTRGRTSAWMASQQAFEDLRQRELSDEKLIYLRNVCGFDDATSQSLVQEKTPRGIQRSPSRSREGY